MNTVKGNAVTTVYEVNMRRIVAVELTETEVLFGGSFVAVVRGLAEGMICNDKSGKSGEFGHHQCCK